MVTSWFGFDYCPSIGRYTDYLEDISSSYHGVDILNIQNILIFNIHQNIVFRKHDISSSSHGVDILSCGRYPSTGIHHKQATSSPFVPDFQHNAEKEKQLDDKHPIFSRIYHKQATSAHFVPDQPSSQCKIRLLKPCLS